MTMGVSRHDSKKSSMVSFADYAHHDGLGRATLVRAGEVSAAELLETAFARIAALNPALNAVIRTRRNQARAEAPRIDPMYRLAR